MRKSGIYLGGGLGVLSIEKDDVLLFPLFGTFCGKPELIWVMSAANQSCAS